MEPSLVVPRGPVATDLLFYQAPKDGSAPYDYVDKPLDGDVPMNFGEETQTVEVHDIRGVETDFGLDKDGFQATGGIVSRDIDFTNDEEIKTTYYREVEQLVLQQIPGSFKVTIFDHTIRRSSPGAARGPVTTVHVDQTARSGPWRVQLHDPQQAEELLKGRVRIINVWRPLNGPVCGFPLAIASMNTVSLEDLVPVEHRYRDRIGETAAVKYNASQQYYYWSGMTNDERLFIKCYDSNDGEGPQGVPHAAFVDSRTPPWARYRESIEVRTLVYG